MIKARKLMHRVANNVCLIVIISVTLVFPACKKEIKKLPGAQKAIDDWFYYRAYPSGKINMTDYSLAFDAAVSAGKSSRSSFTGSWQGIGPKNFGGRTLCLAFNSFNTNTVYAGSAAGGLWRSYSGGMGANAWHPVPTGYPVLGVAAIEISAQDSNVIYIGTGEVYNYTNTGIGFVERTTRGSYGIGILKSIDGGSTWTHSLNWAFDDMKGVQDIKINPVNPQTVFAGTSEGLYRSRDGGSSWNLVHNVLMTTDINFSPIDTSVLYIACGNSGTAGSGIYKSTDGGSTFVKLVNGLPTSYTGKTLIDIPMIAPNTIFASVADQLAQIGLYKSTNGGSSWTLVSSEDVSRYQGWYSHDIAVMPYNPSVMVWAGVDTYRSLNGGTTVTQQAYWYNWDFSATPVGGPEGPGDYVHADVHRVYFKPGSDSTFYLVTDGGIFVTTNAGASFSGHNGMYQTAQFYANVSSSFTDSTFLIGGLQDNATTVYDGAPAWRRVIGGDGMSTAIDPTNDNVVYGASQYLNVQKSTNHAQNFSSVGLPPSSSSPTAFVGPFEMSQSDPDILYAGRSKIYRSSNAAGSWTTMNNGNDIDGSKIVTIAISPSDPDLVYCTTLSDNFQSSGIYKSENGGQTWVSVKQNLPNRVYMDIAIDPVNNDIVYLALSGFNSAHIYKSTDAGASWSISDSGMPNVPHNTLQIDPTNPLIIYAGNDIGVYVSIDGGVVWQDFNDGLQDATLVMSLSVSATPRLIRIGTHGKGVYQRPMLPSTITSVNAIDNDIIPIHVFPNPTSDKVYVRVEEAGSGIEKLELYSVTGSLIKSKIPVKNKNIEFELDLSGVLSGVYILNVKAQGKTKAIRVVKQ